MPYVIYADLESILIPFEIDKNNNSQQLKHMNIYHVLMGIK